MCVEVLQKAAVCLGAFGWNVPVAILAKSSSWAEQPLYYTSHQDAFKHHYLIDGTTNLYQAALCRQSNIFHPRFSVPQMRVPTGSGMVKHGARHLAIRICRSKHVV